jgi:hypothetical protein
MTLLGEQQDITDPQPAVLVAGQTTERPCSVRQQPDSQQPLGAEDVVDSHLGNASMPMLKVLPSAFPQFRGGVPVSTVVPKTLVTGE